MTAVLALVLLRLAIGWHFYKEGIKKFKDPAFSSAPLMQAAVGPFREFYRGQIPDRWGESRLDRRVVGTDFDRYVDEAKRHFGFDDSQRAAADKVLANAKRAYSNYLDGIESDLTEYRLELEEMRRDAAQSVNQQVKFARDRLAAKEKELVAKATPWLKDISAQYRDLQQKITELAASGGRVRPLAIADPSWSFGDVAIKWIIAGAGVLMMLGLFTRVAALVAAGFLLTVMGTQPPWDPDANLQFFYYQFVEFSALMVLIAFAAGRYAGLDYVLAGLWSRCCAPKNN